MKKLLLLPIALVHIIASANSVYRATLPLSWSQGEHFLGDQKITEKEFLFYGLYQAIRSRKEVPCETIHSLNPWVEAEDLKNMAINFAKEAIKESRAYGDIGDQTKAGLAALDLCERIIYCQKVAVKAPSGNITL